MPSSLVRLGVSVLVPLLVAPALAQDTPPVIVASPAQAGRGEREKLAPAAMAQAEAALQAAQAADVAAFEETVKRLRDVETSDPARALAEYRRFLVGRNPSPALGVQVALKVAQTRLKLGDFQGALLTCDVLGRKYAAEPTAVLLSLQKSRVLMGQKKLAEASGCVDKALPDLMALGTQHYAEVSEFLRQLAQANLAEGKDDGKVRARALDVDVEEIYLRWIKKDTIDHLWQRFEALQADYQRAGDERRANELLPKVGDAVLQLPPDPNNIEHAVLALEMAHWLDQQEGNERVNALLQGKQQERSLQFYSLVTRSTDSYHASGALIEGFGRELRRDPKQAEFHLLQIEKEAPNADTRLAARFLLAKARFKAQDWDEFFLIADQVSKEYDQSGKARRAWFFDLALDLDEIKKWATLWQKQPVVVEDSDLQLVFDSPIQQPVERRVFVDTAAPSRLQVTVEGDKERIDVRLEPSPWASELEDVRHQQVVVVVVKPGAPQVKAAIQISESDQPSHVARLRVTVAARATTNAPNDSKEEK